MFGEYVKVNCFNCGKIINVCYGICKIYKDEKGEFFINESVKCECGHILNSERVPNAKFIGTACF